MRSFLVTCVALILWPGYGGKAQAGVQLAITETITASGTFNPSSGAPVTFSDIQGSISLIGNTSNVVYDASSHSYSLTGTAIATYETLSFALADPVKVTFNSSTNAISFADALGSTPAFLTGSSSALSGYTLSTSIGPLTLTGNTSNFGQPFALAGNQGTITLSSLGSSAEFTSVASTPEPATISLAIIGLVCVCGRAGFRRLRARD